MHTHDHNRKYSKCCQSASKKWNRQVTGFTILFPPIDCCVIEYSIMSEGLFNGDIKSDILIVTAYIPKLLYSWLFIDPSAHHYTALTSKFNNFFNRASTMWNNVFWTNVCNVLLLIGCFYITWPCSIPIWPLDDRFHLLGSPQYAIGGRSSLPLRCRGCRFTRNHCACAPMLYISELCEDCTVANEIDYVWTSIHDNGQGVTACDVVLQQRISWVSVSLRLPHPHNAPSPGNTQEHPLSGYK